MRFQQERLYFSTFINAFGSWLTFLAIALLVKEKYGGQQVAWVFLIQTLPAIFFSRGLTGLIPDDKQEKLYWMSQILLAINSLVLCFNQSLFTLYIHLFLSAFLKSVSVPLFNTLVGKWTVKDKIKETFSRIGSIQASTLALAPIAGAWIKISSSYEFLFFIDALSFFISIVILGDLFFKGTDDLTKSVFKGIRIKELFASAAILPKDIPEKLWMNLLVWFAFLVLGALLNAMEFAGFERLKMDEKMIGYALAAWGIGNLIAFLKHINLSSKVICLVYIVTLVVFLITPNAWVAVSIFALGGWSSALFSGILRAEIQASVPEGYNALPVWAFANQVTQVINLISYLGVGVLLNVVGFSIFSVMTIAAGVGLQIVLLKSQKIA